MTEYKRIKKDGLGRHGYLSSDEECKHPAYWLSPVFTYDDKDPGFEHWDRKTHRCHACKWIIEELPPTSTSEE